MTLLRGAALAGLIGLTLAWGLNWPIMKFSLRELSPLYFRAATMTGGSLLLLAWFSASGRDMRLPRSAWLPVTLLAAPNVLGWHLFSILGVQELASGRAAILGFTMPICTAALAVLFFGERLTARCWSRTRSWPVPGARSASSGCRSPRCAGRSERS
jgi:drug/metabolite transporter (DMT)-like permease